MTKPIYSCRYLFWVISGKNPRIERSNLIGADRRTIITSMSLRSPCDLSIDYNNERLYWIDTGYNTVSSSNYGGTEKTSKFILINEIYTLDQPSIAYFAQNDSVFVSDDTMLYSGKYSQNLTDFKVVVYQGSQVGPVRLLQQLASNGNGLHLHL